MKKTTHYQNNQPTLYLIPTPIGNLLDMTFRSIEILKLVDVIYAEDTRVSMKILRHFNISKPLKSYHEHNKYEKTDEIMTELRNGANVGLISDAGMPLISDPGFEVVQIAHEEGFNVVSLPGANALLPGLVMSGLKVMPFLFWGFLDAKKSKRIETLEELKYKNETLVFYEAPHRIHKVLEDMYEVFGERKFSIVREITKAYEEVITGTLSEYATLDEIKGELVLVVEGYHTEVSLNPEITIVEQVDYFVSTGLSKTDAMKKVSLMSGVPKNQIYQEYLEKKRK